VPHRAIQRPQHVLIRRRRDAAHRGPGDDEAELMDRVGRVRHQDGVARAGDRRGQVGQALLGAQSGDDLGFRVEVDRETALIVGSQGAPQPGDALAEGIAMGPRILHRLNQFRDDMWRRRAVGIAHAEVDNVLSGTTGLCLGCIYFGEDVRWKAADTMELAGGIGTHGRPFGVQGRIIVASAAMRRDRKLPR
jgi:hypothetical protein